MGRTAIEFRTHQYRWVSKRHSKNLFNCSNQFFKFTWKTIDRGCFELYLIKGGALHCIVNEVFREKLNEKNGQSGTKIVTALTSVWTALIPNVKEEKKKICQATRRHIPLDSIFTNYFRTRDTRVTSYRCRTESYSCVTPQFRALPLTDARFASTQTSEVQLTPQQFGKINSPLYLENLTCCPHAALYFTKLTSSVLLHT